MKGGIEHDFVESYDDLSINRVSILAGVLWNFAKKVVEDLKEEMFLQENYVEKVPTYHKQKKNDKFPTTNRATVIPPGS